jgi:hypothetical protein
LRPGGHETLSQLVSVVGELAIIGPGGAPPQLVLGGDLLARHDLDLDLPGRQLTLYQAQQCRLDAPPFAGLVYSLPMRTRRNHILVGVEVTGRAADAVFDTGANCRSRHSIPRTLSARIETDGACDGVSASRSAVKPGAFGAPLRGFGA